MPLKTIKTHQNHRISWDISQGSTMELGRSESPQGGDAPRPFVEAPGTWKLLQAGAQRRAGRWAKKSLDGFFHVFLLSFLMDTCVLYMCVCVYIYIYI